MNIGKRIFEEVEKHAVLASLREPEVTNYILMVPLSDLKWLETLTLETTAHEHNPECDHPPDEHFDISSITGRFTSG